MTAIASTIFAFECKPASIEAVNVRKQGKKDDGQVLAVDLKIVVEDLPLRCLAGLLASPPGEVETAFWRIEDLPRLDLEKGDKVDRRFLALAAGFDIPDLEYKGRHLLRLGDLDDVRVSKLAKFHATPQAGQLTNVRFMLSITEPPDDWWAGACKLFREPVHITLEQDAELPLDDASSATERRRRGRKKRDAEGGQAADGSQPALALDAPRAPLAIGHEPKAPLALGHDGDNSPQGETSPDDGIIDAEFTEVPAGEPMTEAEGNTLEGEPEDMAEQNADLGEQLAEARAQLDRDEAIAADVADEAGENGWGDDFTNPDRPNP